MARMPTSTDRSATGSDVSPPRRRGGGFVSHAKLIGAITLLSRLLGLGREMVAAAFFGAGPIWSAFTVAFTIPNLFRKLFGEGALSAAFIPMYARMVGSGGRNEEQSAEDGEATPPEHALFAAASVNLLVYMLTAITLLGELVLAGIWLFADLGRPDYELAVVLTAIMLPYVVLICGAAFLGGILNVHERFAAPAAASVLLNLCLIAAIAAGAVIFDLDTDEGRAAATIWLGVAVVVSGVLQVLMLWPSLRRVGFRFRPGASALTPATKRMLLVSLPVVLSAGVLQISVLLDRSIAFFLAEAEEGAASFWFLGWQVAYPMAEGAAARLAWAQYLYQFPLGVFAIALATAIFPKLSRDAAHHEGRNDDFRDGLRRGIEAALFIGLPASAGLVLVAEPAVRVMFERGRFTPDDTQWTALSTAIYSAAIWAFSLQQIINRAYYALHDTVTPLVWAGINLALNLAIELPLIWTPLGEAGMAAGTLASFSVQSIAMLWLLSRRLGGIGLRRSVAPIAKMVIATVLMTAACLLLRLIPGWPAGTGLRDSALQLGAVMVVGAATYFGIVRLLGVRMR